MSDTQSVLEYKCPCCGAGLAFHGATQKLSCEYCDGSFDLETVKEYNNALGDIQEEGFEWDDQQTADLSQDEQMNMHSFTCNSCGGQIMTENTTAATFCPYCENPTIISGRVIGGLRPDAVIPFKTTKEDAKAAFLRMCKGKRLLPKDYTSSQRLEKITGMYVPFWMYECDSKLNAQYKATRVTTWSDAKYINTKTDHYMLTREAVAAFTDIPMDASSKMDNAITESIEPFDMRDSMDFDTAYLTGFLADKYDVEAKTGEERVRQRVSNTMDDLISSSFAGYSSVVPSAKQLQVNHSKAKYVLLPVWMLHSKYKDETYIFAMNGQTGKITGTLPIDTAKKRLWFTGVAAGVTLLVSLLQWLIL